jgi:hypothetical protein
MKDSLETLSVFLFPMLPWRITDCLTVKKKPAGVDLGRGGAGWEALNQSNDNRL